MGSKDPKDPTWSRSFSWQTRRIWKRKAWRTYLTKVVSSSLWRRFCYMRGIVQRLRVLDDVGEWRDILRILVAVRTRRQRRIYSFSSWMESPDSRPFVLISWPSFQSLILKFEVSVGVPRQILLKRIFRTSAN